MKTKRIKDLFHNGVPDENATIQGWLRTKRELKEFTFIEVNDGSSLKNLQVILDKTISNYEETIVRLNTGSSVEVSGTLATSPGKNQNIELKATTIKIYGDSNPETYPLQKKRHSFEFLRTIGHLRNRTNTLGAVMRIRNSCAMAIHKFFQEKGFMLIHTPIITVNDCEGAGDLFKVTNFDLSNIPRNEKGNTEYTQDFFGKPAYLTVSGQLEAEVMAMAFQNVYTFGPTFRAENSNTSRHLAEFWMVEPEMAFCDLEGNQDVAEEFLKYVFKSVLQSCPEDMEFFNKYIDSTVLETAEKITNKKFERITYTNAINLLENSNKLFEYAVEWGIDLQAEHERYLAEEVFKSPVIVTNYPTVTKAFYMRLNDDQKTVAAMDILFPKIGEIIGGSQREERLDILEERLQAQNIITEDLSWYLDLRRYGTVPHSGFGLGFERMVQFMTGVKNIREVIPFPRTPLNAEF
ncbi:asparagine--tRNA ligase [Candidatus Atelocyanobacterium thalassae]|uniref:Asparagine--tRNA ligase n=1 Tax=cyanobacterium endosymbiont of Braarudosphaera bigelowii TaxID=1285375 RepID=A0ABM7U4B1_9CHRO|nr:asparagine--tRNA ligase [Candidatus Atelocyanobacterium thalassa]BDA39478.1 asparagine--tRNA ligase [cyanobacterium endosymbiont of Braarudosphaera bigelowii]